MKYIIIGLGNFGASLGEKLTRTGHEVIGVDSQLSKVEALKGKISHTISLDCTDPQAVVHLPLKDTDIVIVCIGEDEGANIMATALMRRMKVKRLISRAVSPLHETILEAMGVDEIVHPEEETADRWAKKLTLSGIVDSFELPDDYNIVEVNVPKRFIGKTVLEAAFRKDYNVVVLTIMKVKEERNIIGITKKVVKVQGVASARTVLEEGDILVLFGNIDDLDRVIKE